MGFPQLYGLWEFKYDVVFEREVGYKWLWFNIRRVHHFGGIPMTSSLAIGWIELYTFFGGMGSAWNRLDRFLVRGGRITC